MKHFPLQKSFKTEITEFYLILNKYLNKLYYHWESECDFSDLNKFINDKLNIQKKSESSKNKLNPSIIFNINNSGNKIENNNKINDNLYQRDSNYDFDNNYIEDKFRNKIKANIINNINFLNPSIHYEEKEHEKENANISTGTVTKANSIVSLQKKVRIHYQIDLII